MKVDYLGSRLKLADMSAVRDAMGLRRSRLLTPKYPVPEDDAEVEFKQFELDDPDDNDPNEEE